MQACGFPDLPAHKDEHVEFTDRVYGIREKFLSDGESAITEELFDYLKGWLNGHILIQDMAYKPYASGQSHVSDVARSFGPGLSERTSDEK
jgi:hemerythrin